MKLAKLLIMGMVMLTIPVRWAYTAQSTPSLPGVQGQIPVPPKITVPSEEWFKKGDAALTVGDYTHAIECFKQAIALMPKQADYHLYLGIAYGENGMLDKSLEAFKAALEINPDNAAAYDNLGTTYYKKSMLDEAIAAYKKAISLDPGNGSAHINLGIIYQKKEMLDEAIAAYKKALTIDPSSPNTHYNLGNTYYKKKMYDESIAAFKKVLELNPKHAMAHQVLGMVYRDKGEPSLAADHFYQAGVLFLTQGKRENALDTYDQLKQTKSKAELERALYKELYPTPDAQ